MRLPTFESTDTESTGSSDSTAPRESTALEGSASSGGRLRIAVLVLAGVAVAVYAVRRYVDRPEAVPIDERAVEDVAGDRQNPATEADAVVDDAETTVDMADERSSAEIEERAEQTQPEPGEMAVDEDVADELTSDDGGEASQMGSGEDAADEPGDDTADETSDDDRV